MQYVPTGSSTIAAAAGTATADTTTKNRKKTNNKSQEKDSVGLGDAENIMFYRIPASQVENTTFYPVLDSMVCPVM
jgi:hypothetical protein